MTVVLVAVAVIAVVALNLAAWVFAYPAFRKRRLEIEARSERLRAEVDHATRSRRRLP